MVSPEELRKVENFHKRKRMIQKIILKTIKKKEIIHGEQAVRIRVPTHLRRFTRDYDVFSPTPLKDAKEAEMALEKKMGDDYFKVVSAEHKGTHKVKSKIDGKGYADFTKPDREIPFDTIKGHNYIKVKAIKERIKQILKDKSQTHRHDKDRDTLNRIRIYEAKKKQQRKPKPKKQSLGLGTLKLKNKRKSIWS